MPSSYSSVRRRMTTRWWAATALFAAPLGGIVAQAAAANDSTRLQGTWTMISGAADGYPLPPEYVQQMKRVYRGNELSVTMGSQLYFKATITLDTTTTPRAIDYRMTAGFTAGAVQLGIYAFNGDTVRFCFAAPGKTRPTDFITIAADGRTVSTWVRAKP